MSAARSCEIKNIINTMVDQLRSFASEVTRVAREVGTEGKLGGQAAVPGVSGTWKDLTDNVNFMAGNLTSQVRGIARVVTAVANGDLTRKLTVEAEGEIAALSDTINGMIDTLATFADQVTTVAREVGVEGKLGGQASVPGAAGTWKDLTDNVNQLAANLTTQVRAIAEVATAVTKGDLTRRFRWRRRRSRGAQGQHQRDDPQPEGHDAQERRAGLAEDEPRQVHPHAAGPERPADGRSDDAVGAGAGGLGAAGVFYVLDGADEAPGLRLLASYAHREHEALGDGSQLGEGLIGQCAVERRKIELRSVPPDYLQISSGLGEAPPLNLVVLPVLFEGQVKAVLELASFERFNPMHQAFLDQLTESIGIVLNTIEANMRTEDLLKQSQSLARELQTAAAGAAANEPAARREGQAAGRAERRSRAEEHRGRTGAPGARRESQAARAHLEVQVRVPREHVARAADAAQQPADPVGPALAATPSGNLTGKQVEFAQTIHASGNDLLTLINDILDLSKIESGTVVVEMEDYALDDLRTYVDRTFRHVAEAQRLDFSIDIDSRLPRSFETDPKRLQQVLKNLLSNAFKFTERGSVSLRVYAARERLEPRPRCAEPGRDRCLAIAVSDTGIGIPPEKQQIIFEAFQQADGSTSRKYGGTGLGLAISREMARLLGGEMRAPEQPRRGSTFTLYLPQTHARARASAPSCPRRSTRQPRRPQRRRRRSSPPPEPMPVDVRTIATAFSRAIACCWSSTTMWHSPASCSISARERGYKALTTAFGAAAIAMARERQPDAITLDICLPDIDGWHVLDRLKHDLATRHIPVFVITTEEDSARAYALGAVGVLTKPVHTKDALSVVFDTLTERSARPRANLVIIGRDDVATHKLKVTLEDPQLVVHTPGTWDEAKTLLARERVDCLALDGANCEQALADLADMPGTLQSPDRGVCAEGAVTPRGTPGEASRRSAGRADRPVAGTADRRHGAPAPSAV